MTSNFEVGGFWVWDFRNSTVSNEANSLALQQTKDFVKGLTEDLQAYKSVTNNVKKSPKT